jgi:hypothetical protein
VALWRGDLARARRWFGAARAAPTDIEAITWFGPDPAISAAAHDSLRLWAAGQVREARAQHAVAVHRAERLGHPFTTAQALGLAAIIETLGQRWQPAAELASRAIALSERYEFPRWSGTALVCRGRALAGLGDAARGLGEMKEGRDLLRRAGVRLGWSLIEALQADAYERLGEVAKGLAAADAGLAHGADTGERLFEPLLQRLKEALSPRRVPVLQPRPG